MEEDLRTVLTGVPEGRSQGDRVLTLDKKIRVRTEDIKMMY